MIRPVQINDAAALCDIYNYYVQYTIINFEEQIVSIQEMQNRITEITPDLPWLVSEEDGIINGYAYASPWKSRCAYRFSVESTVYPNPEFKGRGIGSRLYESLLAEFRTRSFHSVIGGISLPNDASVALYEKLGFVKVAHFKQVGWKMGQWIDVGYWELLFTERC